MFDKFLKFYFEANFSKKIKNEFKLILLLINILQEMRKIRKFSLIAATKQKFIIILLLKKYITLAKIII